MDCETSGTMSFCLDETKVEIFSHNKQHHVWQISNTSYQKKKPVWSMPGCSTEVDDLGWFCMYSPLDILQSLIQPQTPMQTKVFLSNERP